MIDGMARVEPDDAPQVLLRDYLDAIPSPDFQGHDFSERRIETVERAPGHPWVHVVIGGATANVFLVVVVNVAGPHIHGHHVLDLVDHYGLDAS